MATRVAFAAVVFLAFAGSLSRAEDQLPWATDFAQACQQANAQGKLVLLHFYSDDCPPCVRVEKNVFSQAAVAEAVGKSCVPVKVHVRKSPELATKYRVQQWPTDVFVTSAGQEVTRSVSPQSPDMYIAMTNSVAARAGVAAFKNQAHNIAAAPPHTSPAPWAPAPQNVIAQVNAQADAVAPWMAQGAADAKLQAQQSAQQIQQSAQQFQQGATQQAQQAWQYAQGQANQTMTNTTQAAQQATHTAQQTAQQSTQAAADAAKEIINRYAQPMAAAATPPPAPSSAIAPTVAPASGTMPWQVPAAAVAAPPASQPALTLPPANPPQVAPAEANPALAPSPAASATTYPIAMGGYCPVTLATEKKWKKGQPQFGVMHRRRTFLFTSEIEQKKFLLDPDRYTPVMTGYDPVKFMQTGELVDGSPAYSLTYRKEVYLFTSDAALKSFWQNPAQFTEGLRQAMSQQERGTQLR